jgi:hypothetical protein
VQEVTEDVNWKEQTWVQVLNEIAVDVIPNGWHMKRVMMIGL